MILYNVYDSSFNLRGEMEAKNIEDALMYVTKYMHIPAPILSPVDPVPGFIHRAGLEGLEYDFRHEHYQSPGPHLFGGSVESPSGNRPLGPRGKVFRSHDVVQSGSWAVPPDRTGRRGRPLDS